MVKMVSFPQCSGINEINKKEKNTITTNGAYSINIEAMNFKKDIGFIAPGS